MLLAPGLRVLDQEHVIEPLALMQHGAGNLDGIVECEATEDAGRRIGLCRKPLD